MTRTFTLIKRIASFLLGAVAIFILFSFIPFEGNYTFRVVESGSMEPAIKVGSVIATIPRADYDAGDVVTFVRSGSNSTPTTHRIISVEEEGGSPVFATKGDANSDPDLNSITKEDILGRVFLSVPYAGYVAFFMQTNYGISLVITLLLAWIFLPKILTKVDGKRSEQ